MKIYLNGLEKDATFDEVVKRHIIYTNDGIFCNYKKKLTRIEYDDTEDKMIIGEYTFLINKGKEVYGETILHIPFDHLYCEETFEKKHIGYDIFYVKHSYFDQISYYFEVEHLEDFIMDEIISFLSHD